MMRGSLWVAQGYWVAAMLLASFLIWMPLPAIVADALPDVMFILLLWALLWRYPSGEYGSMALWGLWLDAVTQGALGAYLFFYVALAWCYWHHQKRMLLYSYMQRCVLLLLVMMVKAALLLLLQWFSCHKVVIIGGVWGQVSTFIVLVTMLKYTEMTMTRKTDRSWLV